MFAIEATKRTSSATGKSLKSPANSSIPYVPLAEPTFCVFAFAAAEALGSAFLLCLVLGGGASPGGVWGSE